MVLAILGLDLILPSARQRYGVVLREYSGSVRWLGLGLGVMDAKLIRPYLPNCNTNFGEETRVDKLAWPPFFLPTLDLYALGILQHESKIACRQVSAGRCALSVNHTYALCFLFRSRL